MLSHRNQSISIDKTNQIHTVSPYRKLERFLRNGEVAISNAPAGAVDQLGLDIALVGDSRLRSAPPQAFHFADGIVRCLAFYVPLR